MLTGKTSSDHITISLVQDQSKDLQDKIDGGTKYTIQHGQLDWYFHRGFAGANALAEAIEVANDLPIDILLVEDSEVCAILAQSPLSSSSDEYTSNGNKAFKDLLSLANAFHETIKSVNPKQADGFLIELSKILLMLNSRSSTLYELKQDDFAAIKNALNHANTDAPTPKKFRKNPSGIRDLLIELAMNYLGCSDTRVIINHKL